MCVPHIFQEPFIWSTLLLDSVLVRTQEFAAFIWFKMRTVTVHQQNGLESGVCPWKWVHTNSHTQEETWRQTYSRRNHTMCSKKRTADSKNRFNQEWADSFFPQALLKQYVSYVPRLRQLWSSNTNKAQIFWQTWPLKSKLKANK